VKCWLLEMRCFTRYQAELGGFFSLPFAIGRSFFPRGARFYSRMKFAQLALRAELRMRGEEPGALPCTLYSDHLNSLTLPFCLYSHSGRPRLGR
jgi:hypothetical protein